MNYAKSIGHESASTLFWGGKAAKGVYKLDWVEHFRKEQLQRILRGINKRAGFVHAHPELQHLVTFTQINLLKKSVQGPFDVLFCQYVMIYKDKPKHLMILKN